MIRVAGEKTIYMKMHDDNRFQQMEAQKSRLKEK